MNIFIIYQPKRNKVHIQETILTLQSRREEKSFFLCLERRGRRGREGEIVCMIFTHLFDQMPPMSHPRGAALRFHHKPEQISLCCLNDKSRPNMFAMLVGLFADPSIPLPHPLYPLLLHSLLQPSLHPPPILI